jgi:hypothetical protein
MGFEFEEGQPYIMPAHFGQVTQGWNGEAAHYEDNTALTILYVTEREVVEPLLPPGFVAMDPPVVSVSFVMCRGVDFMAGGGYNLVAVNVSARFAGTRDKVEGNFALVLWENDFMPIVVGREILGAPKLMADIPDAWMRDGKKGFTVSEHGTLLLEGEVSDLQELSDDAKKALAVQVESQTWMSWKYVPSCDLRGADVSNATALPSRGEIREAWMGQGTIVFHETAWEKAPMSYRIVNALRQLPVVQYQGGIVTRGWQDLLIREQYRME